MATEKENKPKEKKTLLSRRPIVTSLAAILGLAIAGIGIEETYRVIRKNTILNTYGIRDKPKFTIKTPIASDSRILTYGNTFSTGYRRKTELFKKIIKFVDLNRKELDKAEEKVRFLQEYFNQNKLSDAQAHKIKEYEFYKDPNLVRYKSQLNSLSRMYVNLGAADTNVSSMMGVLSNVRLSDVKFDIQVNSIGRAMDRGSHTKDEDKYGDIDETTKKLVKNMTSQEIPSDLEFSVEDIENENVSGNFNSLTGKIKTEDAHYAKVLNRRGHELGHAFTQHSEKMYQRILGLFRRSDWGTDSIEEACAYTFQIASAYYVDNPELSQIMKFSMLMYVKDFLYEYFEGNHECHREGIAIAIGAIDHFGDPTKAFNYLQTTPYDKIKPAIWNIIKKYKMDYFRFKELAEDTEKQMYGLSERIDKLQKRIGDLEKKYDPSYISPQKAMKILKDEKILEHSAPEQ